MLQYLTKIIFIKCHEQTLNWLALPLLLVSHLVVLADKRVHIHTNRSAA